MNDMANGYNNNVVGSKNNQCAGDIMEAYSIFPDSNFKSVEDLNKCDYYDFKYLIITMLKELEGLVSLEDSVRLSKAINSGDRVMMYFTALNLLEKHTDTLELIDSEDCHTEYLLDHGLLDYHGVSVISVEEDLLTEDEDNYIELCNMI